MTSQELLHELIHQGQDFLNYLQKLESYIPRCNRCDDILDRPGEALCFDCHVTDLEENE